jgi:hypothetical protein
MSFKVQMQMMGIFGLMPHQMGTTLEPSWGRKEGRKEGREGGREREGIRMQKLQRILQFPNRNLFESTELLLLLLLFLHQEAFILIQTKEMKQILTAPVLEKSFSHLLSLSFFPPLHG